MATQPSTIPFWATANPTDGVSGQPAILVPAAGKIASGHLRLERPPRQDFNYLFNLIGLWVEYLDQQVALNDAHRTSDGSGHANVAANTSANALDLTHRSGDGSDHADVASNTSAVATINSPMVTISDTLESTPTGTWTPGTSNNKFKDLGPNVTDTLQLFTWDFSGVLSAASSLSIDIDVSSIITGSSVIAEGPVTIFIGGSLPTERILGFVEFTGTTAKFYKADGVDFPTGTIRIKGQTVTNSDFP